MLTAKKSYPHTTVMSNPVTAQQQNDDLDLEDIEEDIEFSNVDDEDLYSDSEYDSKSCHRSGGSSRSKFTGQDESHDENRKDHHNQLERKRRASIKGSYNELKDTIPGLKGSKASRAVILQRAVDCIADLSRKNKEHYQCVDILMRENEILERQVNDLQRASDRLDNEDEIMMVGNHNMNGSNGPSQGSSFHRNGNGPANGADLPIFRTLNNSNASSAYSTSSDASSSNSSLANGLTVPLLNAAKKTSTPSSASSSTPIALQFVASAATDILQSIQNDGSSNNSHQTSPSSSTTITSGSGGPSTSTAPSSTNLVMKKVPKILPGNVIVRRHIASTSSDGSGPSGTPASVTVMVSGAEGSQLRPITTQSNSTANNNSESKGLLKINHQSDNTFSTSSGSIQPSQPASTVISPYVIRPANYVLKKTTVMTYNQISLGSNQNPTPTVTTIEPKTIGLPSTSASKILIKSPQSQTPR